MSWYENLENSKPEDGFVTMGEILGDKELDVDLTAVEARDAGKELNEYQKEECRKFDKFCERMKKRNPNWPDIDDKYDIEAKRQPTIPN